MKYKILSNGEEINRIVADESFCKTYCDQNEYTYEPILDEDPVITTASVEPTTEEILNALLGVTSNE